MKPYKVPSEVEQLAQELFEGYGTRRWPDCTDKHYWHARAQKLVESGWRKTND